MRRTVRPLAALAKDSVLDRIEAMKGYTAENTRVLCQPCDTTVQIERGYK
jgi:hypothetical protein